MLVQHERGGVGASGRLRAKVGHRRHTLAQMIYRHFVMDLRLVVRGDDFTFTGTVVVLKRIPTKMREWYDVKVRGRSDGRMTEGSTKQTRNCVAETSRKWVYV